MKIIRDLLVRIVEEIDAGNSYLTEAELLSAAGVLQELARKDVPMSKYEACNYLNVSRATFDRMVRDGKIPEGVKQCGFKEKMWFKKDLNTLLSKSGSSSR